MTPRRPSAMRATILRTVVAGTVLVGGYVGLCAWSASHLPASVYVGTTSVGGLSLTDAEAAVQTGGEKVLATPVALTLPGVEKPLSVVPSSVGFGVDAAGSIDGLTDFTLNPVTVWTRLTGTVRAPLLTTVDDEALKTYVASLAPEVDVAAVEGKVTFPKGVLEVVEPKSGQTLDVAGTVRALRAAVPWTDTVTGVVTEAEPKVAPAAFATAVDQLAKPAVAGPVTLLVDGKKVTLSTADFAPTLTFDTANGTPALDVDEKKLQTILADRAKVVSTAPKDASFTFKDGRPSIVPSIDGMRLDEKALAGQVATAIRGTERDITVELVTDKPKFTTADAEKAGVKEIVVDFKSPFPGGDPTRTQNLVVASRTINGHYMAPGDTFSLNGILGERTTAKGYADGTVIINGRLTRGTGGGISQVSTVIYNMAYFAGAQIIEAMPHAFFIPRYPEGREATVYWPTVDNKWKNDTPHGMLLQTWVADGYVHGRVWSTKTWDITSVKGPRRNIVPPKVIRDGSPRCYPQEANPGFDVTVTREFRRPGSSALVKKQSYSTHYIPEDRIICTDPNAKP